MDVRAKNPIHFVLFSKNLTLLNKEKNHFYLISQACYFSIKRLVSNLTFPGSGATLLWSARREMFGQVL